MEPDDLYTECLVFWNRYRHQHLPIQLLRLERHPSRQRDCAIIDGYLQNSGYLDRQSWARLGETFVPHLSSPGPWLLFACVSQPAPRSYVFSLTFRGFIKHSYGTVIEVLSFSFYSY